MAQLQRMYTLHKVVSGECPCQPHYQTTSDHGQFAPEATPSPPPSVALDSKDEDAADGDNDDASDDDDGDASSTDDMST